MTRLLVPAVGEQGGVAVGNPVRLDRYSEPQPDFSVLRPRSYRAALPQPEDTLLAVEVHRTPDGDAYRSATQAGLAGVLTIAAPPSVRIPVAQIFA